MTIPRDHHHQCHDSTYQEQHKSQEDKNRFFCAVEVARGSGKTSYGEMKWFEKLRLAREQAGFTQAQMAEFLGYSGPSSYTKLEQGTLTSAPFEKVALAASIVGVSLDFMADEANDDPPELPFTDDEILILQLVRDLGLDRGEAMRRLAASAPRTGSGVLREIAGPADLTPLLRAHQAKSKPKSKLKPARDDEGSDVGDTPATAER